MKHGTAFFVRLAIAGALSLTSIAALVGAVAHQGVEDRVLDSRRYAVRGIGAFSRFKIDSPLNIVDLRTGESTKIKLDDGDVVDLATISPWTDSQGQAQMVGRWRNYQGRGGSTQMTMEGLARYSYPQGKLLDLAKLDILPISPPCWLRGLEASVAFAAGDGQLYAYRFDPIPDAKPTRIAWITDALADVEMIHDLHRIDSPEMEGYFLASVCEDVSQNADAPKASGNASDAPRVRRLPPFRLWWLRLDEERLAVVDGGPLNLPPGNEESVERRRIQERWPIAFRNSAGKLTLAYLKAAPPYVLYDLWITPLEIDAETVGLKCSKPAIRCQTYCRASGPPCFSQDGRWFLVKQNAAPQEIAYHRHNLDLERISLLSE